MLVSWGVSLSMGVFFSHSWRTLPLKLCQLPKAPWPFRYASLGIPPTHSLSKPISACLKFQVCALLLTSLTVGSHTPLFCCHCNQSCQWFLPPVLFLLLSGQQIQLCVSLVDPSKTCSKQLSLTPPQNLLDSLCPTTMPNQKMSGRWESETSKTAGVGDPETYSGCWNWSTTHPWTGGW